MRYSHVGIVVENMKESVDFYTKVLGCIVQKQGKDEITQYTLLKAGNQKIELLQFLDDKKKRAEGVISHIAFRVENMEREIEKLKEKGVSLSTEIPRESVDGIKIYFFKGPSGESIELLQLPK
ncbi:VOC family protein [Gottfriedia acidiceleris]|uniref:VOC family protein n=1 Tax=Gottfriedia acidiceleris TaxID=371036 RepID=UPI002F26B38B